MVLGAGIGYRAAEIPAAPDRLAESGFADSLPSFEANGVGHLVKTAAAQYRAIALEARDLYPGRRLPGGAPRGGPVPPDVEDPLVRVLRSGWTPDAAALGPWLNRVFAAEWVNDLEKRPTSRPAYTRTPRPGLLHRRRTRSLNLRDMTLALRVRAMQRQAAGDSDAFPRLLKAGLAAVRTARYRGGLQSVDVALDSELRSCPACPSGWIGSTGGPTWSAKS